MNVLLVDDEPLVLEQMEYMIQSIYPFWKFHKAADACQALTLNQNHKINLAFLDINLPGRSGLEFGEDLRALNKEVEIIIVTAHQSFDYAQQSIRIGVVDYLTKPVIESDLHKVLAKYDKRESSHNYSTLIHHSLSFIHENYAEKLSLSDIAREVHTNPTYLSRKFHEEVGTSFSEYLMHYRIKAAKRALTNNTSWSISDVAEKSGFNSQHYFSTLFRKIEGITPKEFREKGK
ncbi:AraC family transcriptional regulator [Peribacillus simplex]|jgi:YesN/AraC family two-component response regulator|uniref:response regulator transcription factor n=1 Tax=Peribacillus simplex TaxID=1478 RepID=UPI000BA612BF|nr:AraC family transcriptional regulator [Peribacillus simplex]MBX9953481.1 AraC family transcriptional regulator [Peribacillus simplex]PAK40671.1 DNA-binding response regulator [Peribacillus simplex]